MCIRCFCIIEIQLGFSYFLNHYCKTIYEITHLSDWTADSIAFCSDGSPWQGLAAAFWRVPMWTCGLPKVWKITFSALVTLVIERIKLYISLASLLCYHQKNNLIIVHIVNFFTLVSKNHKMLLFIILFHLICFLKKGVSF